MVTRSCLLPVIFHGEIYQRHRIDRHIDTYVLIQGVIIFIRVSPYTDGDYYWSLREGQGRIIVNLALQ